ncbi:MAG: outer membrane lipoprotein carrier protein LolA, partial [Fibrobacteres bacterium]|nr:outer membrane lipoprotein carrier protein LolA [Fibrobacterota bacterium]
MADSANSNGRGLLPAIAILIAIGMAASARTALAGDAPAAPPVAAGPAATAAPADSSAFKEAKAALRKAIAFHREAQDLSLKFTAQVYNAALDKHDAYQGRFLLKGADKFRLEIPGGTFVSDGTTYWEYHAQTKQAIRKAAA